MTIEERAKEYAQAYNPKESAVQYAVERAYCIGAIDQEKIDIEKAFEWLKEELYTDHNEADFRYPDSVESRSYFKAEELVNEFRKAMEE